MGRPASHAPGQQRSQARPRARGISSSSWRSCSHATALHTGALGALIGMARRPLYPIYAERAAQYAQDALADQELAGLGMWIVGRFLFTLVGFALFTAWLGELERRARRMSAQ